MGDCNLGYRVIMYNLPTSIKGFTVNQDGSNTIILNSRLSYEQNLKSFEHEVKHIKNKDFEKKDANLIELKTRR